MEKNRVFRVEGMTCQHCKASVTKAIQGLAGVSSVDVSLEGKTATVDYDEARVSPEQIKDAIAEAGYQVVA